MDGKNSGYLELLNLTEVQADLLNTPYITCDTLTASVGNITTGNITTLNSTDINTNNADIDNLTIPTLTANKIVLSNASDKLISSLYTDTDMAIKSVANTFTQTNTFNNVVINNQVLGATGSVALPTYSFDGDPNTGMYRTGADSLGFSCGGSNRLIMSTVLTCGGAVRNVDGTAGGPSITFANDTNTGLFRSADDTLNIVTNGNTRLSVSNSGVNVPNLNASKIVLSDASDNLISSTLTDTDLPTLAGSNTFTGATNTFNNAINLPARTASKLLLTDASKNVVSSTLNDTDLPTLAGSNTFTGATNTFNNAINLPARTASKLLLTDGSKNVVSSTFTDTDLAPKNDPTFTTKITTPDIVLNNARVSLGSTQTTTSLTTGCLIGDNLSNGGFNNVGMINSSGTLITAQGANRFYVSQLRNAQLNAGVLLYDNTTKEVSYSATLPTLTTSGLTISGLTASRAVVSNASKALTSASFNLPSISGTNGFLLLTDGTATTSWSDPLLLPISTATQTALNLKANIASPAFTGQITMPLGSVATPSLSITGDLNTGIFSAGADTLNLVSNATTRLSISNSGVNVPNLTASKLVLSDASDNLVSSAYTDTDILNNKMIDTCKAPLSLLTFTNQQVFYCPIYVDKPQTFSSIYFGFNIPAGATNLNPYMGLATLAVYNASSLTSTHPNFISSTVSTKITASDTGEIGLFLINIPATKSYNTMYKHTYSSPFSLSAGRYFLALLMESAAPALYNNAFQASFPSNSNVMTISAFNLDTISLTVGSCSVFADLTHSASTTFTYTISGTSLSITGTPSPYYVFPNCYLNSISGGLYIVSQTSGMIGGIGLYTVSTSQSPSSGTMTLSSSRYSGTILSLGTGTGRTGTYNMTPSFAVITVGSITGSSTAFQFTHTAATTASYVPLGVTTSNSYNYQQTGQTSLPSTATPAASTSMPYMALST